MRIAVIGAGNVGGSLGRRWAELGHDVIFGVRESNAGASAVKGGGVLPARARMASPSQAVRGAEAVLLATPWNAVAEVVRGLGAEGQLDGLPLLDATNPLGPGLTLDVGPKGESGAERVQSLAPRAHVVKIFNTTGFNNMQNPVYGGAATTMFFAGDDAGAKAIASSLAAALGFEPIDAGPLRRARELEHLALLWISLAFGGMGREIAFRLVRR